MTASSSPDLSSVPHAEFDTLESFEQLEAPAPVIAQRATAPEITVEAISRHVRRQSRTKFGIKPVTVAAPAKPKSRLSGNFWIGALCLSTLVLLVSGIGQRQFMVRHFPQTAGLFKSIGLPVNLRGLEIRDVKTRLVEESGQTILAVEGTVSNIIKGTNKVPQMRVSLRGTDDRELYSWTVAPGTAKLEPGATMLFRTRLASPPPNAKIALVNFAEAADLK